MRGTQMTTNFDGDVVAATIQEYVLFGVPVRVSSSTFSGHYDLVGSTGDNDNGVEFWFAGDEDLTESGVFIRGDVERGVLNDLVAREIDTLDAWQDEDGTARILIAADGNEVVLTGDPDNLGWVASLDA
jgi:hypothetical protein